MAVEVTRRHLPAKLAVRIDEQRQDPVASDTQISLRRMNQGVVGPL